MTSCKKNRILISMHMDNELTENESIELNEHIKNCERCKAKYLQLKELKSLFLNNNAPIVYTGEVIPQKNKTIFFNLALIAAAFLLVIGLGLGLSRLSYNYIQLTNTSNVSSNVLIEKEYPLGVLHYLNEDPSTSNTTYDNPMEVYISLSE